MTRETSEALSTCAAAPGRVTDDDRPVATLAGLLARGESRFLHTACLSLFLCVSAASADVFDLRITDVTTKAFSVVWVSDDLVIDARVRVFEDAEGTVEITDLLTIDLLSLDVPEALPNGLIKVDVVGLEPDTTYYLYTETDLGDELAPESLELPAQGESLVPVTTAAETTKSNPDGTPIVNDVLLVDVDSPDGVTPTAGALVLVEAPGISEYPVTAFVGAGVEAPGALIDLNNVYDDESGASSEVPGGTVLNIIEYRGQVCLDGDREAHKLTRSRRAPEHTESPIITELELPAACFSPEGIAADPDCDGRIGLIDFTRFLAKFQTEAPDCKFFRDFDYNDDDRVGLQDFTQFLSVFGLEE